MSKLSFLFVLSVAFILFNANNLRATSYSLEKELVIALSEKELPFDLAVSLDRLHIAVAVQTNSGESYIRNDRAFKSKTFDRLVSVNYSPDGLRLAYMYARANHYYVTVDSTEYGKYVWLDPDSVVFSDNSRHFVFTASSKGRMDAPENVFVVTDGRNGKKYGTTVGPDPMFSPSKNVVSYFARNKNNFYFIQGEKRGQKFDQTGGGPHFSEDGEIVAYWGIKKNKGYIVYNDSLFGPYHGCRNISLSPDGSSISYYVIEKKGENMQIYVNGEKLGDYSSAMWPMFSPNGKRLAFWATDGEKQFIVIDSQPDSAFTQVSDPMFSPSGNHYYYRIFESQSNRASRLVIDGVLQVEMSGDLEDTPVFFSQDETRIAYIWDIDSTTEMVVIDSVQYGPYQGVGDIVFSRDGKHSVFLAKLESQEGLSIVLNGESLELVPAAVVGPNIVFSPLNNDLAFYVDDTESNQRALAINDSIFESFSFTIPTNLEFNSAGEIIYYTIESDGVYRLTFTPKLDGNSVE